MYASPYYRYEALDHQSFSINIVIEFHHHFIQIQSHYYVIFFSLSYIGLDVGYLA